MTVKSYKEVWSTAKMFCVDSEHKTAVLKMYSRETQGAWEVYQTLHNEKTNSGGDNCPVLSSPAIWIFRGADCIKGQARVG